MAFFGNTWDEDWEGMGDPIGTRILSWNTFLSLSDRLMNKLPTDAFDMIICVNSGGLVLGKLVKDYLSLPLGVITAKLYKEGENNGLEEVRIGEVSTVYSIGGDVLLVDDLVDSGKTMHVIIKNLLHEHRAITSIKVATIYAKPNSIVVPDYFVEKTDKWIVFPYERNEFKKLQI